MIIDYQYSVSSVSQSARPHGAIDAVGVFLSQLCLLHCFLLPAVLALLPSLDFHSLPGGEAIHFGILLLSTPTAIYALLSGRRFHHLTKPLVFGVVGLSLLWAGTALDHSHVLPHSWTHFVAAVGSLFLFAAHVTNWRAVKASKSCACSHAHAHSH